MNLKTIFSKQKARENILTEADKREFCGHLLREYNLYLDPSDDMLPLYYMTYMATAFLKETAIKTGEDCLRSGERLKDSMDEFSLTTRATLNLFEKIFSETLPKLAPSQIKFADKGQAFSYGFGKWGIAACLLSIGLLSAWLIAANWRREDKKAHSLLMFTQKSQIFEKELDKRTGVTYIRLQKAADYDHALAAEHYVYNKECNCIEVPLYFFNK